MSLDNLMLKMSSGVNQFEIYKLVDFKLYFNLYLIKYATYIFISKNETRKGTRSWTLNEYKQANRKKTRLSVVQSATSMICMNTTLGSRRVR